MLTILPRALWVRCFQIYRREHSALSSGSHPLVVGKELWEAAITQSTRWWTLRQRHQWAGPWAEGGAPAGSVPWAVPPPSCWRATRVLEGGGRGTFMNRPPRTTSLTHLDSSAPPAQKCLSSNLTAHDLSLLKGLNCDHPCHPQVQRRDGLHVSVKPHFFY